MVDNLNLSVIVVDKVEYVIQLLNKYQVLEWSWLT